MQIWPHSATLSEIGATQAGAGAGGGLQTSQGGQAPSPHAGEVALNRAESVALAALEGEEDTDEGMRRAGAESGLSKDQLKTLQRRAAHLSSKGYTLKGAHFMKKPLADVADREGLAPAAKEEAKKKTKTAEATAVAVRTEGIQDLYTCDKTDRYRLPTSHSLGTPEVDPTDDPAQEASSMTTLAALLAKRRRAKY